MKRIFEKLTIVYYNYIQHAIEYVFKNSPVSNKINGKCLMFHHITDEVVDAPSTCVCSVSKFQNYILDLIQQGYKAVSIEEAMKIIEESCTTKFFIVTFDDITESVYTNAYQFLRENNIPFTIFIAVNLLGKNGYITKQQLKELNMDSLCTVGSHTQNHVILRYSELKKSEIIESKTILQDIIGRDVSYFAYPYGSIHAVDCKSIKLARKHYKCAFSTLNTELNRCSCINKWFLPRIYVNDKTH